jgi:hypothetical protein
LLLLFIISTMRNFFESGLRQIVKRTMGSLRELALEKKLKQYKPWFQFWKIVLRK